MVKLNKIYTRGGDKGETSLGDGNRVKKHDLLVEAYGTVDEANSMIGLARIETAKLPDDGLADAMLKRIQNDLFDLGADLCTPAGDGKRAMNALRIVQSQVDRLEQEIDTLNKDLGELTSFILPGGTAAAAHLHVARTVVRRAERLIAAALESHPVSRLALTYANRLSDHLFVLARYANARAGSGDVLWVPGANR